MKITNTLTYGLVLLSSAFFISCGNPGASKGVSSSGGNGEVGSDVGCGAMNALECDMFVRVNEYRVSQGLVPFLSLERCVQMAQDHAKDMVVRGFFDHNSPTETFSQRVRRYNLATASVGENLARGSDKVDIILNLWKNSPEHNANMLQPSFRSIGIGFYQDYWVQCFSSLH